MSLGHAYKLAEDGTSIRAAVHIAIPLGNNPLGNSWSDVLRVGRGTPVSVKGLQENDNAEWLELKGAVTKIELLVTVPFVAVGGTQPEDLTPVQRQVQFNAYLDQMQLDILDPNSDLYAQEIAPYSFYLYEYED